VATVHLSVFPQDKAKEILEAVKSNSKKYKTRFIATRALAIA
jgi:ribosome-binding factor A